MLKASDMDPKAVSQIDPSKVELKYVTAYVYKGKADGSWSCEIDHNIEVTVNDKKSTIKAGTSIDGDIEEDFKIATIVVEDSAPKWMQELKFGTLPTDKLQPLTSPKELNDSSIAISPTVSPAEYWMHNGNSITDRILLPAVQKTGSDMGYIYWKLGLIDPIQAAQLSNVGQTIQCANWKIRSRSRITEAGEIALVPVYVLPFTYEDDNYHIVGWGFDNNVICHVPSSKEAVNQLSPKEQAKAEMPDKLKTLNLVKWGWIVAIIALFAVNLVTAIICLAMWGGAMWYFNKDINSRAKEIEAERQKSVQRLAAAIDRQLMV